jgi:hypothetical protein
MPRFCSDEGVCRDPLTAVSPPPWSVDEANDACFIVRDGTGQALGYFYFEDEPRPALGDQQADPRRGPPHCGRTSPSCRNCCRAKRTAVSLQPAVITEIVQWQNETRLSWLLYVCQLKASRLQGVVVK